MRFRLSIPTVFVVCCLALGCGQAGSQGTQPDVRVAQLVDNPVPNAGEVARTPIVRKIVYTSRIEVIVEDMQLAQQKLTSLIISVREHGGYPGQSSVKHLQNQRGAFQTRIRSSRRSFVCLGDFL